MKRLLVALLCITPAWGGYSYQRIVTLGSSSVIPASQSSFTVLVCGNAASGVCNASVAGLNQSGAGAHVLNLDTATSPYTATFPAPADLIFSTTACASPTLMNWEIDNYVASTGELEAWVLVTSLAANGTFYLCYGNSAITAFQGGTLGSAWDSNIYQVFHLGNASTISTTDFKGNANGSITGSPSASAGLIAGGITTTSSSNYIDIGNGFSNVSQAAVTFSAWVNFTTLNTINGIVGVNALGAGAVDSFFQYTSCGPVGICLSITTGTGRQTLGHAAPATGSWHQVVGVYDGTNMYVYVDGSAGAPVSKTGTITASATHMAIGVVSSDTLDGSIDEVHISSVGRGANWILTEYNNVSSPGTFSAWGVETPVGVGGGCSNRILLLGVGC